MVTTSKIDVPGWNRHKTSWWFAYTVTVSVTGHHLEYTVLFFTASLWHLYKTLLPEYLEKHWPFLASRQNGVRDQASQSHSRKQQNVRSHSVRWSVTKDQLGWGFTVSKVWPPSMKNDDDSVAYMVLTSSLTMEVEAVTHCFSWFKRWQSDHTCHHPRRFNSWARYWEWKVEWEPKTGMSSRKWRPVDEFDSWDKFISTWVLSSKN